MTLFVPENAPPRSVDVRCPFCWRRIPGHRESAQLAWLADHLFDAHPGEWAMLEVYVEAARAWALAKVDGA
jgi:hypothetical protein